VRDLAPQRVTLLVRVAVVVALFAVLSLSSPTHVLQVWRSVVVAATLLCVRECVCVCTCRLQGNHFAEASSNAIAAKCDDEYVAASVCS
jgi:hypothetical protein